MDWNDKQAVREYNKAWRKSHPEAIRKKKHRYYLRHKDEISAKHKARFANMTPEKRRAHNDRGVEWYRNATPEQKAKRLATAKAWRRRNKDHVLEMQRARYKENPQKQREHTKLWRAKARNKKQCNEYKKAATKLLKTCPHCDGVVSIRAWNFRKQQLTEGKEWITYEQLQRENKRLHKAVRTLRSSASANKRRTAKHRTKRASVKARGRTRSTKRLHKRS